MKYFITIGLLWLCTLSAGAQKQTYDIITYTEPAGWDKKITDNGISYTRINNNTKSWCRISLTKSTQSKGAVDTDFENEWQEFIVKTYHPAGKPVSAAIKQADGWKIKTGSAKFVFNNTEATAMLVTASGYNLCTSIISTTNNEEYLPALQSFIAAVSFNKPQITAATTIKNQNADSITGGSAIVGMWGKSNTVSQINNRFGTYSYNKQQYTFNTNGTYYFNAKNYSEQYNETLLIKETGTYTIKGNNLTITPKNSVIESWTKKNGGDNWNRLKTSQKRKIEIVNYQFSIVNNNLQLQTATATERDGSFNNGNTYSYGPPGTFTPIKLPGEEK